MTENDVLLQQTEDGHHKFVDAPGEAPKVDNASAARDAMPIGTSVQLKSGGPVMTINRWTLGPEDEWSYECYAECLWFDGAKLEAAPFHWSMLKLVP